MDSVQIDGKLYEVVHTFSENRVIVDYDGLYALADRDAGRGTWDLSGVPATPAESAVLSTFTEEARDVTEVTVTKDGTD
jgi:hypothetical protein